MSQLCPQARCDDTGCGKQVDEWKRRNEKVNHAAKQKRCSLWIDCLSTPASTSTSNSGGSDTYHGRYGVGKNDSEARKNQKYPQKRSFWNNCKKPKRIVRMKYIIIVIIVQSVLFSLSLSTMDTMKNISNGP